MCYKNASTKKTMDEVYQSRPQVLTASTLACFFSCWEGVAGGDADRRVEGHGSRQKEAERLLRLPHRSLTSSTPATEVRDGHHDERVIEEW